MERPNCKINGISIWIEQINRKDEENETKYTKIHTMHAVRFISHRLRYVLPSTPHTKRFGLEITDFTAGSYGGQVIEQITQCGIKFWSSKQCCPTGHWTCLQEAAIITIIITTNPTMKLPCNARAQITQSQTWMRSIQPERGTTNEKKATNCDAKWRKERGAAKKPATQSKVECKQKKETPWKMNAN